MTLCSDTWIHEAAIGGGMIDPFVPELCRQVEHPTLPGPVRALSFGLSSYGYDLRLSPREFLIFRRVPGAIVDPKDFQPETLESAPLHADEKGVFFVLPAHSYGLGVALERLRMPDDVTGVCLGKSTYARCGVIANMTPVEAGWEGHLTLEFSNSSGADVRLYANEGICQVLFFRGEPCRTTYQARAGKYQSQGHAVVTARA